MTESNTPLVSIVIPFFQRESDVLKRTLDSIFAQRGFDNYYVIIVDDGSPIRAVDEFAGYPEEQQRKIKLIEQVNAGAGAARNAALEALPAQTDYVAFLDSDDAWEPDFLAISVACLEKGYDLFFSDTQRENKQGTRFSWGMKNGEQWQAEQHTALGDKAACYAFRGNFFDYAIVRTNILSTSATVYRRSAAPDLKFETRLYNGQDRLFKVMLAREVRSVVFSANVLVQEYGGVNIFDNSQWGSPDSLRFLNSYINLSKITLEKIELNASQTALIRSRLRESRFSMVASMLHLATSGKKLDWKHIRKTCQDDPAFAFYFLPNLFTLLMNKLVKRA